LIHWESNTFKVDWYDIRVPDGLLHFKYDSKNEILGFTLDQQNLLDVDFSELNILKSDN